MKKALRRMREVATAGLVALVIAALTFGVAHTVLHPSDPEMSLTAGSGFTITSNIYSTSACSGSTAELYPGTTRYICFTVQNSLNVPITVGSISMALSNTPSTGCTAADLSLPTFSGSLNVLGSGSASTTGLPIELKDDGQQSPQCENQTLDFTYTGSAEYTDLTTTSLASSSGNTSTYGSSVTFTATVTETNASQDPSGSLAGGTVTFYSCTSASCTGTPTQLGSGTVGSNGQATYATSTLPIGTDYIEGIYGGAGSNLTGSTSNVVTQTVNSGTLSTTSVLTSSPNPSTYGSSVTFTDTVSAISGTPAGTVTFYSCTTNTCSTKTSLGTGTLNSSGKATYSTSALPVGTTYVEAIYGASGNYLGSTSNVVSQVVNALSTSSVLTSSPNPSSYGSSVTFTDTVSASSGTPSGTVTFYSCTTNTCSTKTLLGTGTLSGGKATYSTSALPVGMTYVEAVYGASGNYLGSTSNVVSQVVNALSTTSSLTSTPNPSTFGTSVSFTDTVSASTTPTGTVTFYRCTTSACTTKTSLGTGTLNSPGKATYSTSALPVGTTYVEAVYGASGNYTGSTSNVVSQVVNALGTTSVLTSSPNPSTYGSSVTFTDTVSASSGTPAGTVTFYSCTTNTCSTKTSLGTGTLNSSGKATYSTSALPVGTTYVEAIYGASGNYLGSTSNVVSQVVNALSTSSVLTSSPNPSSYGSSVTFTDTVSASSGTPGGSVTFYSCTSNTCSTKTSLGTGTLSGGKATYSTSTLPVGTTYVEAIYGASGNYGTSTSNVVSQVVLNVPSVCAAGGYNDVITGTPASPFLYGTNANDLIYAFGASYWIEGNAGNDCIDAGDGNNVIFDGNGNDGVSAGNGSNTVILGNGSDKVSLGNGSDGVETGDGNDIVALGNGSKSEVIVGDGNDSVTVGTGSYNDITLGSGTDTVTIQSPGSHDEIDGGAGNETIYLGSGSYNSYSGQVHHTNTCHLPKPPSSWHGTVPAYYHDTITNCTVVSP